MHEKLPRVDWMVGTGLVALAILSVFYGSAELTSNIASGLIGFLGRTVTGREERCTPHSGQTDRSPRDANEQAATQ
ncbi:MAG: hypothetical protein HXO75_03945 [Selenomonas artemidis]|nr:hypothetical protein [Selenomonas artemidis]